MPFIDTKQAACSGPRRNRRLSAEAVILASADSYAASELIEELPRCPLGKGAEPPLYLIGRFRLQSHVFAVSPRLMPGPASLPHRATTLPGVGGLLMQMVAGEMQFCKRCSSDSELVARSPGRLPAADSPSHYQRRSAHNYSFWADREAFPLTPEFLLCVGRIAHVAGSRFVLVRESKLYANTAASYRGKPRDCLVLSSLSTRPPPSFPLFRLPPIFPLRLPFRCLIFQSV